MKKIDASNHLTRDGTNVVLIDSHGRRINDLRISVTDRCNLRCSYCAPADNLCFAKPEQLLDFDEIIQIAQAAVCLGIKKFRLTGGEPLIRKGLSDLVYRLHQLPDVEQVPITTNGVLLEEQCESLYAAGARRLNISLDALNQDRYQSITRSDVLNRVLAGITAAQDIGFHIKINMLPMRGVNEEQIIPMAHWAIERGLHLRFIEYMPFACNGWSIEQVIPASELRERLSQAFELENGKRDQQDSPAVDYPVTGTDASIGIIACVTEPFCRHCSRMRLTPDGRLRPCLHDDKEYDIVGPLRAGADTDTLHTIFRSAAWSKSSGRAPFPTTNGSINKVTFRPMIHMGG